MIISKRGGGINMSDQSSKMEPWVLVLILVCVLAFFGGLWALGSGVASTIEESTIPIQAQVESNSTSIKGNTEYLQSIVERLDKMNSPAAEKAAPAQEAATEEEAEEEGGE